MKTTSIMTTTTAILLFMWMSMVWSRGADAQTHSPARLSEAKLRQTTVTISGDRFSGITEVSLADTPERIRFMHDSGVHVANITDVPQAFLESWQILARRAQTLREIDPASKDYIYSPDQLRSQLRNQPREKVVAALGPCDFTVSTKMSFGGLGSLTLSKGFHFTEIYQNRRIRESTPDPLGLINDLLAREYNALIIDYIKDSASGTYRVREVDFGERRPSGLILVESGRPGGRELEIYHEKAKSYLYRFGYFAVHPQGASKEINATFEGPAPEGEVIVFRFVRQQMIPLLQIFEKWETATEEAAKQNKDKEIEIGILKGSNRTCSFTFRYEAARRRSILRVVTISGEERLQAEVPSEALETWKNFFRDSDEVLRESAEFLKPRG